VISSGDQLCSKAARLQNAKQVSLYKTFSITEGVKLRFNIDAFNAFNIQGRRNPDATSGIQQLQTPYWTPRQVQFSIRLSF
jgi:hypothetical protein